MANRLHRLVRQLREAREETFVSDRAAREVSNAVQALARTHDAATAIKQYKELVDGLQYVFKNFADQHPDPHAIRLWQLGHELDTEVRKIRAELPAGAVGAGLSTVWPKSWVT